MLIWSPETKSTACQKKAMNSTQIACPLEVNQVHQGDCVENLAQVQPGSVDLVFADPPFNIGYDYDVYDDAQSSEAYLTFCREWIEGVHRALKDDGSYWLAIGDEYAAELKLLSQEIGFHCRSWVIWYYTFGVNCVRGFSRSHTHLFHFVKDPEAFTFNGDNPTVRVPSARQLVYADARANPKGRLPDNTWILRPQDAPETGFSPWHDTWYYARVAGTFKEREGFHGCQMPEQLLGRIIRVSSEPGDLVLDPFGGSGTTLVTAKKLGRRFMGFELSDEYVTRINQRLSSCQVGDPLDGPEDPVRSTVSTKQGKSRTQFVNGRPVIPLTDENREAICDAYESTLEFAESSEQTVPTDGLDILLEPDLNACFIKHCKAAKLLGDARTWNEFLLAMSDSKLLPKQQSRSKSKLSQTVNHSAPAEIAFQLMSVDYGMEMEALFSTPAAATEFDQIAEQFADAQTAGLSASTLRHAIWELRESVQRRSIVNAVKKNAAELLNLQPNHEWSISDFLAEQADSQQKYKGVYVIGDAASPLYIGQTNDLHSAVQWVAGNSAWQRFKPLDVQVYLQSKTKDALVLRLFLVSRFRPWLNAHFMHQKVATSLF